MTISGPFGQGTSSIIPESLAPGPAQTTAKSAGQVQVIGSSGQATISPWGALVAKMYDLSLKDPNALRQVAGTMSQAVATAAQNASGSDATALKTLGSNLAQVAKTGDLSVMKHPRHHHAAAGVLKGGTGTLLNSLLSMVDHVLGPDATSPWPSFSDLMSG
jgi:hypothetical protein